MSKKWTLDDRKQLLALIRDSISAREIAFSLKRSENSVRQKAFNLGISFKQPCDQLPPDALKEDANFNPQRPHILGKRFDRLTVIRDMGPNSRGSWLCQCDCGKKRIARGFDLIHGITTNCGCLTGWRISQKLTKHGFARDPRNSFYKGTHAHAEYQTWANVLRRCDQAAAPTSFNRSWAGRGIKVCERWRFGDGVRGGFECFLADMGLRPSPQHSIDRIDNDGDYRPDNCRWATRVQQARNKRSNARILFRGQMITFAEATAVAGVSRYAIKYRLETGWSTEDAICVPPISNQERGRIRRRGVKHPYRQGSPILNPLPTERTK